MSDKEIRRPPKGVGFTRIPCRTPLATKLVASRKPPEGSVPPPRHLIRHAASFGPFYDKMTKTRCVSDKQRLIAVRHVASFDHFGHFTKNEPKPPSHAEVFGLILKNDQNDQKPKIGPKTSAWNGGISTSKPCEAVASEVSRPADPISSNQPTTTQPRSRQARN